MRRTSQILICSYGDSEEAEAIALEPAAYPIFRKSQTALIAFDLITHLLK